MKLELGIILKLGFENEIVLERNWNLGLFEN